MQEYLWKLGDNMIGILCSMFILMGVLIIFSVIYKKEVGRNFFKDIFNDVFGK